MIINWAIVIGMLIYFGLSIPAIWNTILVEKRVKSARLKSHLKTDRYSLKFNLVTVFVWTVLILFLPFLGIYHWVSTFDKVKENTFKVMIYTFVKDLKNTSLTNEEKDGIISYMGSLFVELFENKDIMARFLMISLSVLSQDDMRFLSNQITNYVQKHGPLFISENNNGTTANLQQ
jgi:hypothetical protein